jgi:hypothetical protein
MAMEKPAVAATSYPRETNNDAAVAPNMQREESLQFSTVESFRRASYHSLPADRSMHDVSLLMRPQDADLLESIHFSTTNGCESPYIQGAFPADDILRVPSLNLEDESDAADDDVGLYELAASPGDDAAAVISKHSHYKSPARVNKKTFLRKDSKNMEDGDAAENRMRRALSGEVFKKNGIPTSQESTTVSDGAGLLQSTKANDLLKDEPSEDHKRLDSLTRRMNEAQQFAEAVGDLHPNDQEKLRIIEDDVHDDESDDEDQKAVVCMQSDPPEVAARGESVELQLQTPNKDDVPVRRKARPAWPFGSATRRGFMDKLPDAGTQQDFVYKGIRANPPNIVKRGTDRGNYAQLHRKAWLEVSDKYHRYGKHLRVYYRHWESLGCPYNMFFEWLDSKGEAAGQPLPNLPECPRSELDSDTVLYIASDEISHGYALSFLSDDQGRGRIVDVDGDPVKTGPDGWIFVLRDNVMYGARKITSVKGKSKQRFHHSSFFGGKAVAAAGIFVTDDEGYITRLYPHSGHYRPGDAHMQRMLFFLHNEGVDLRTFDMDMQQIMHIARDAPEPKKDVDDAAGVDKADKKKKVETLMLVPAVEVACHLAHKARFIGENIFSQIHRIRASGATTVTEALAAIDDS